MLAARFLYCILPDSISTMAKDTASSGKAAPSGSGASAKNFYLTAYNFASAILWLTVLGRTAGAAYLRGPEFVPIAVGQFVRYTQTIALLEVVHSILGSSPPPSLYTAIK